MEIRIFNLFGEYLYFTLLTLQCLVSIKSSLVPKKTFRWKMQVCLSMYTFYYTPGTKRLIFNANTESAKLTKLVPKQKKQLSIISASVELQYVCSDGRMTLYPPFLSNFWRTCFRMVCNSFIPLATVLSQKVFWPVAPLHAPAHILQYLACSFF